MNKGNIYVIRVGSTFVFQYKSLQKSLFIKLKVSINTFEIDDCLFFVFYLNTKENSKL